MDDKARLAYEAIAGRVSDSHWYRTKRLLGKHQLELTVENIQFFAQLRQTIPRSAVGVSGLLDAYRQAQKVLRTTKEFTGAEVLALLAKYGVRPHQTTISRWFKPLGGYRRNKEYTPAQLKSIFTQAFLYKAQFCEVEHGQVC